MAAAANRWCRVERMSGAEVLVVMGVSGVGKTTVGERLAARLGWTFLDADDLHPPANVAKMRGGHPLNDADRGPWLDAVGRWIDARAAERRPAVVACSALKRAYRDRLGRAAQWCGSFTWRRRGPRSRNDWPAARAT